MSVDRQVTEVAPRASLRTIIEDLPPAYFALVMATGIVSIVAHDLVRAELGFAMFCLNVGLYAALVALFVVRLLWYPHRCRADLHDPRSGPGYFTWIAGTAVLGVQFAMFTQAHVVAIGFFIFAIVLAAVLSYTVFAALAVRPVKPTLEAGINGGWLIPVVAMQSLVELETYIAGYLEPSARLELHFAALSLWLAGIILYLWLGLLIFYRCFFFVISPKNILPTLWISMGAMAISTLAGSTLILASYQHVPYLAALRPFLEGVTVLCWAGGTWWIPLLLILGVWRHVVRGVRLSYDPLYWGLVFPLGMYAAATEHMSQSMRLSFLDPVPEVFCYVSLLAWIVVFIGLVRRIITTVVEGKRAC